MLIGLILLTNCDSANNKNNDEFLCEVVNNVSEIDANVLIKPDSTIVYSANRYKQYELLGYKNGETSSISRSERDIFRPFLFDKNICGLSDFEGDENFYSVNFELEKYFGKEPIQKITSSPRGKYLIVQFLNDSNIYLIDTENKTKSVLATCNIRFHTAVFDKRDMYVVLSYDDKLVLYDIKLNSTTSIGSNIGGEKKGLSLYQDTLFFSNDFESNHSQIFKLCLINTGTKSKLVYQESGHDLLLPRFDGIYLYYVEVINSEYLLVRRNLSKQRQQFLTTQGVVYNYHFYLDNKITLVYSDFKTPRSLMIYDLSKMTMQNVSHSSTDIGASYTYLQKKSELSPAYQLTPQDITNIKGVVLFFHPGLHSDFSPRWDTVLMSLISQGYVTFVPNYPMSFGYGKNYYNATFVDAVKDMLKWKVELKTQYPHKSVHFLSMSSGNLLMEACLSINQSDISSAVSLFGLYQHEIPQCEVPLLYFLGKNDPKINFQIRNRMISEAKIKNKNIKLQVYNNEGHWIRKRKNLKDAILSILIFIEQNK